MAYQQQKNISHRLGSPRSGCWQSAAKRIEQIGKKLCNPLNISISAHLVSTRPSYAFPSTSLAAITGKLLLNNHYVPRMRLIPSRAFDSLESLMIRGLLLSPFNVKTQALRWLVSYFKHHLVNDIEPTWGPLDSLGPIVLLCILKNILVIN